MYKYMRIEKTWNITLFLIRYKWWNGYFESIVFKVKTQERSLLGFLLAFSMSVHEFLQPSADKVCHNTCNYRDKEWNDYFIYHRFHLLSGRNDWQPYYNMKKGVKNLKFVSNFHKWLCFFYIFLYNNNGLKNEGRYYD